MTTPLIKAMVLAQPDGPVVEGNPVFVALGVVCIILAIYLAYRLLKGRGGLREQSAGLDRRTKELKKLIKRTQYDFYKRRIEEDKADKLIREYEEELKSATEQIKGLQKKCGGMQTSRWAYLRPRNIAQIAAIAVLILLGIFLLSESGSQSEREFYDASIYPDMGPEDCSKISDPDGRSDCYRKEAEAISKENPLDAIKLCNRTESSQMRDECYESIAYDVFGYDQELGIGVCSWIEDEGKRENCCRGTLINQGDRLNENPELALRACSFFSERERGYCYYDIAKEMGGVQTEIALEACSKIENQMDKENCIMENVVYFMDDNSKAAQVCSGLDRRAEDCFRNLLSEVEDVNEAIDICGYAKDRFGEECVTKLIYEFGFELGLEDCKSIEPEKTREDCMWQLLYSGSLTDCHDVIGVCESINKDREKCYEDEYLNKGSGTFIKECPDESVEICEEAFEGYRVVDCYWNVARQVAGVDPNSAIDACGRITESQKANECYRDVAREIADENPSVAKKACEEIDDDWMQEDCKNAI
jgi:hypothetical protein